MPDSRLDNRRSEEPAGQDSRHLRGDDLPVLVVGAGVIGMTTAVRLAEAGHCVRVLARERTPGTTSDVAGAVWFPFLGGEPERALAWGRRSLEVFRDLAEDPAAGVVWQEGVELFTDPVSDDPWWRPAVSVFRRARPADLPPGFEDGYVFRVPVVRMPVYMRWLEGRFLALGGAIEERTVEDLDALHRESPYVVHCTGIGARALTGDTDLHPVRGQVVRMEPGLSSRFLGAESAGPAGGLAYVIPHADCTVLGGTEDEGAWDLTPDPEVARAILERCATLAPAVGRARVLGHAAGLRPVRREVRLETERRGGGVVVHHYGHGGSGVTFSWGCAEEAARLLESAMREGA
jgi:D-amino-acid oxidase